MKINQDFVTNSSSTIFILSSRAQLGRMEYTITVDLISDLHPKVFKTIDDLNNYFDPSDRDYIGCDYLKAKEEIEKGRVVYLFNISTDDCENATQSLLTYGLEKENFNNNDLKIVKEMDGIW